MGMSYDTQGNPIYVPTADEVAAREARAKMPSDFDVFQKQLGALGYGGGGAGGFSTNTVNQYSNRLNSLLENPDSIQNTGAYKWRFNQGQQALERSAAAKGMMGSGNTLAALSDYGQGQASQAYDSEANRLAQLASAKDSNMLQLQSSRDNAATNAYKAFEGRRRFIIA